MRMVGCVDKSKKLRLTTTLRTEIMRGESRTGVAGHEDRASRVTDQQAIIGDA